LLFILIRFGLPALIRMVAFIGDIKSSNQPVERQDQLAPQPPTLNPVAEATNSAQINLSGFSEAGTSVKLFVRGISVNETIASDDGEFEFQDVHLREGENEIYCTALDDQGNTSDTSKAWTINVDAEKPSLSLESPTDGDKFFDNDNPIPIKGKSEAGVEVRLNNRFIRTDNNGEFETSLSLSEGDNEIEVKAVDEAGNESVTRVKVNYSP